MTGIGKVEVDLLKSKVVICLAKYICVVHDVSKSGRQYSARQLIPRVAQSSGPTRYLKIYRLKLEPETKK